MWVLDHLDDVASDMSVFHRVDDVTALDGATFLRLAYRLPSYRGVMRDVVLRQQQEREDNSQAPSGQPAHAAPGGLGPKPGTRTLIENDPMFAGIFSFAAPEPADPGQAGQRPDLRRQAQQEYPELQPGR